MKKYTFVIEFAGKEIYTGEIEASTINEAETTIWEMSDLSILEKDHDNL